MILPLKKQVCSLELSKRLNELGVRQDALWRWVVETGNTYIENKDSLFKIHNDHLLDIYSAFTVAELGEMLPKEIKVKDPTQKAEYNREYEFTLSISFWHKFEYWKTITNSPIEQHRKLSGPEFRIRYFTVDRNFNPDFGVDVSAETEADARAKMLIELIELGHVKVKEL